MFMATHHKGYYELSFYLFFLSIPFFLFIVVICSLSTLALSLQKKTSPTSPKMMLRGHKKSPTYASKCPAPTANEQREYPDKGVRSPIVAAFKHRWRRQPVQTLQQPGFVRGASGVCQVTTPETAERNCAAVGDVWREGGSLGS